MPLFCAHSGAKTGNHFSLNALYALTAYPTTDLSDAYPDKLRRVSTPFQDFGARRLFAGRIRTAVTMEDSKLIQDALFATPGEGGVIVVDGGGSLRTALLGDRMAERLIDNGWAGVVINGAVRDTKQNSLSFTTKAKGKILRKQRSKQGFRGRSPENLLRALAALDLGVKALGTTPLRSAKTGVGAIDVPIAFGNVLLEPGQCLYCDEDGVLVADESLIL